MFYPHAIQEKQSQLAEILEWVMKRDNYLLIGSNYRLLMKSPISRLSGWDYAIPYI
jgi:hypothetical protein